MSNDHRRFEKRDVRRLSQQQGITYQQAQRLMRKQRADAGHRTVASGPADLLLAPLRSAQDPVNSKTIPFARDASGRTLEIIDDALRCKLLITGKRGAGKTELIKRMALGSVAAGSSVVAIGSGTRLTDDLIRLIAVHYPERLDDVVVIDFSDHQRPPAFNPLDLSDEEDLELVARVAGETIIEHHQRLGPAPRAANMIVRGLQALATANIRSTAAVTANTAVDRADSVRKYSVADLYGFLTQDAFREKVMSHLNSGDPSWDTYGPDGWYSNTHPQSQEDMTGMFLMPLSDEELQQTTLPAWAGRENRIDFGEMIGRDNAIILVRVDSGDKRGDRDWAGTAAGRNLLAQLSLSVGEWGERLDETTGEPLGRGARIYIDDADRFINRDGSVLALLSQGRLHGYCAVMAMERSDSIWGEQDNLRLHGNCSSRITLPAVKPELEARYLRTPNAEGRVGALGSQQLMTQYLLTNGREQQVLSEVLEASLLPLLGTPNLTREQWSRRSEVLRRSKDRTTASD